MAQKVRFAPGLVCTPQALLSGGIAVSDEEVTHAMRSENAGFCDILY